MPKGQAKIELARGCSLASVARWLDAGLTTKLVEFFRNRHEDRFFGPIDCLMDAAQSHHGYGFSMMSVCCLLVETLQCYREGLPTTSSIEWKELLRIQRNESVPAQYKLPHSLPINGKQAFLRFFARYKTFFPGIDGGSFYANIRNGLLHQGQTKGGWTIDIQGSMLCDPTSKNIHRNFFARQLRASFNDYLGELRGCSWSDDLWIKAARKTWWLIRLSKG